MKNILLYTCPLDNKSGGIQNIFLFFDLCRKKGYNIFLCPLLKHIPSLNFFSPFNNKNLEEITQKEFDSYYGTDYNKFVVNLKMLKTRDNIVIYTEDVIGNPSHQNYVVRWLNFFPHPAAVKKYSFEKDYICFFSNYIFNLYDNLCKNVNMNNYMHDKIKTPNLLRVFHFDKDIYTDYKNSRKGSCFIVRKGYPPYSFFFSEKPEILNKLKSKNNMIIKKNKNL